MCVHMHTFTDTYWDIEAQIKSPVWIYIHKVTGLHTCPRGLNNKVKSLMRIHRKRHQYTLRSPKTRHQHESIV